MRIDTIYESLNAYRKSKHKPILNYNNLIEQVAQEHNDAMANGSRPFSHEGINDRLNKLRHEITTKNFVKGSENVAMTKPDANPIEMWKKSSGHDANMLGDYTDVGIACSKSKNLNWFYTAIFIKLKEKDA